MARLLLWCMLIAAATAAGEQSNANLCQAEETVLSGAFTCTLSKAEGSRGEVEVQVLGQQSYPSAPSSLWGSAWPVWPARFLARLHPRSLAASFLTLRGLRRIFYSRRVVLHSSFMAECENSMEASVEFELSAQEGAEGGEWSPVCERHGSSYVPQRWKWWWRGEEFFSSCGARGDAVEECRVTAQPSDSPRFRIRIKTADRWRQTGPSVVDLTVSIDEKPNVLLLQLPLILVVLHVVRIYFSTSKILQLFVAALFGSLILVCIVVLFVLRDLQHTRIGQIGVVTLFGIGGFAAVSEGALSALLSFVYRQAAYRTGVQLVLAGAACVSATVAHRYFHQQLALAVRWGLLAGECAVLLWLFFGYFEFSLLAVAVALLAARLLFRGRVWPGLSSCGTTEHLAPRDNFPSAVYEERHYVKPTFVAQSPGGTKSERLRAYNSIGSETTQRELRKLAAVVRRDPSRFAKIVHAPNDLMRWAGVHNQQQDDDDYDNDEEEYE